MTRPTRLISLALVLAVACGVALGAPTESEGPVNSNLNSELFYQLLIGELSAQNGDTASAYALMLDAARKANSPRLYERAVELALIARNGDSALQASQAWARAFPASRDANRYVLQILIGLNRMSEVLEPLKRDLAGLSAKDRTIAIALLPRYFVRAGDKKAATAVVEQALAPDLTSAHTGPVAWSTLGRLRLMAEDAEGALDAARRGAALNAKAEEPILLALNLAGAQAPAAEALIRKYLADKPSPEIRMGYARKLLDAQRYTESYAQMQRLNAEQPGFADAWLVRGSLELQDRKWDAAETSLKKYVALVEPQDKAAQSSEPNRGLVQAYLLLAQIAEQSQRLDDANAYLQRIDSPQDSLRVQGRRAMILARQGKMEEARTLIHSIPEQQPEDARAKISLEVQLLRDYKLYPAAYQVLTDAIARNPKDIDLVYDQAMLAEKMGNITEMERLLRQVIAAKPDYHHAYNALGYSLADRNLRLPEARQLVKKALEFAPEDPYIVDSLAWVEFRSGNAPEALRLLQSAYQARPDAEIAAHLGEVLWSLGQRGAAADVWKQGMQLNAENETLIETIKRLNPKP
jgi:tetratricopeptide (TPR) repeat protein